MKPYYKIFGYRYISVSQDVAADILNVCMKYRYRYGEMRNEDGRTVFLFTYLTSRRVISKCRDLGIDVELGAVSGLPELFFRYRTRVGLWLGLAVAFCIIFSSGRLVWDIRVSGNETLSAEDVENVLSDCGFSRGTYLPDFNADRTEAMALLRCDELAWISVNMKGTVAYVEVREKSPIEEKPHNKLPANIVAERSGQIVEIIAYNGVAEVKAGDEVTEGQLLISGVYGEKAPGVVVTRAAGYVKARTVRTFSVEIPYEYSEKIRTGAKKSEKFVIFFSNPIKVFANSGNLYTSCDKIEEEKYFYLFGERLPFGSRTVSYLEYDTVTKYYTAAEARAIAEAELEAKIGYELEGAEIVSRDVTETVGEDSLILTYEIVSIENIALTKEFEIQYKQ